MIAKDHRLRQALLIATLIVSSWVAAAATERPFNFDFCFSAETTTLPLTEKDVAISWSRLVGVANSQLADSLFDRAWFQCVGNATVINEIFSVTDNCSFSNHNGDTLAATVHRVNDRASGKDLENSFQIISGSGKYAGITGTGKIKHSYLFPEDVADLIVGCDRMQGNYSIP